MSATVGRRSEKSMRAVAAAAKGLHLMGGSEAMRAAGEAYLPKFKVEEAEDYQARLAQSWLFNGYKKTCEDMIGMLFKSPVEMTSAPDQIVEWSENINMMGDDLSTFAAEVEKDAIRAGMSFILVEAPRIAEGTSLADQEAQNLRPYFIHVTVEDVLDWRTATVNNVQVLSHIRIRETVEVAKESDEFETEYISRIRVMDLVEGAVNVRIFQSTSSTSRKGDERYYDLIDEYQTGLDAITVVPVYSNRKGFWRAEPMLSDLADVNIAHWQSQSDQRNILHFYRVPILFAAGVEVDENNPLVIKAGSAVRTSDPQATLQWTEGGDSAINAGRQDLKDLEFQMQVLGLQLLISQQETATGAALDASKETTRLGVMADNLKDALETAFGWAADYGNIEVGEMSVEVNKEFGISMLTAQEVTALLAAVNTGNLSRETFIDELKRRSFIREDLDTDDEVERIDDAAPDLGVEIAA